MLTLEKEITTFSFTFKGGGGGEIRRNTIPSSSLPASFISGDVPLQNRKPHLLDGRCMFMQQTCWIFSILFSPSICKPYQNTENRIIYNGPGFLKFIYKALQTLL